MLGKRRKYKITFSKTYQAVSWGVWKEVTDSYILYILNEVKEKHDFEIVSFDIKDCFRKSEVVIKCEKNCKSAIFIKFCNALSGQIENVKVE